MIWETPENFPNSTLVKVTPSIEGIELLCEYNVDSYISLYGGTKVEGVYILRHQRLDVIQAIRHFLVLDGGIYIDPTPYHQDEICFLPIKINSYSLCVKTPDLLNIKVNQESQMSYYVYLYVDPKNSLPIYVGKGKGNRYEYHLQHLDITSKDDNKRFRSKLRKLDREGLSPTIIMVAENIESEEVAYEIEKDLIKFFGIKKYEEGGVLLNICKDANPPSHKGKTYEEIYGKERGEEQRKRRHQMQIDAGGWFRGGRHSEETRKHISQSLKSRAEQTTPSREEVKKFLYDFCQHFSFKISQSKLNCWIKDKPFQRRNFKIPEGYIRFCKDSFDVVEDNGRMMWYHNKDTGKSIQIRDWQIEMGYRTLDEGYVSGRGCFPGLYAPSKQETQITSYIIGGVKNDATKTSFSDFKL